MDSFLIFVLLISGSSRLIKATDSVLTADSINSNNESSFIELLIPTATASNISQKCIEDSQHYVKALLNYSRWAIMMYQSSGKLNDEFIFQLVSSGNNTDSRNINYETGLFDECLSIDANGVFQGKYCTVSFTSEPLLDTEIFDDDHDPSTLLLFGTSTKRLANPKVRDVYRPINMYDTVPVVGVAGFCLPSSCSFGDLRTAVAQRIGYNTIGSENKNSIVTIVDDDYCYTQQKTGSQFGLLDGPAIAVISILLFICLLVACATIHEAWRISKGGDDQRITNEDAFFVRALHCFSVINNGKKLLSTKVSSKTNLSCLHGLRLLMAVWVVIGHVIAESTYRNTYNAKSMINKATEWTSQIINNGSLSVDVFFLMSGILVAQSLLRELDKNKGRFNIILHYLHRYLRLTPLYAVLLAVIATLLARMGSGPDWNYVRYMSEDCRSNWWSHLLYFQNYIPGKTFTFCMPETWYLACEMQMFWISPLIIYPLWRWKRVGLFWMAANMAAFIGSNFAVHIIWNIPPILQHHQPETNAIIQDYLIHYYIPVYTRIPCYLLGILLGWILHRRKESTPKIGKWTVAFGWLFSVIQLVGVIHGLVPYMKGDLPAGIVPFFRVTYGSLHRFLFTTSVGWIIFACVNGFGGIVNRFLSLKVFVPLARLTYAVYLIHLTYIKVYVSHSRKPNYFTMMDVGTSIMGILGSVFALAVIFTLMFEIPFLNLEELLLPKRKAVIISGSGSHHPPAQTIPKTKM